MITSAVDAPSRRGALEAALRGCENVLAILGGVIMLVAMLLTTADALLRYAFNAPLVFNYYLTENYLMVGMLVLPMAWGFREGGYIRIMALAQAVPAAVSNLVIRVGLLLSCVYAATLAWLAGRYFLDVYTRGDVQMGIIDWPVSWSWISIPIGMGFLALRLLFTAVGPDRRLHVQHDDTAEDGV